MIPFALTHFSFSPAPVPPAIEDEKTRLLTESIDASLETVELLHYKNVGTAVDSTADAFRNDPLINYLRAGDKRNFGKIHKANSAVHFATAIRSRNKVVYTMGKGKGNVIATPAKAKSGGPDHIDRLLSHILGAYNAFLEKLIMTKEQRKRIKELRAKFAALITDYVEKDVDEMIYIDQLATSPECQGRGFGSALVRAVTFQADLEGRITFLFSSNIQNTAFYNSCGFVTLANAVIGDSNPCWDAPPIVVPLMFRKPNGSALTPN